MKHTLTVITATLLILGFTGCVSHRPANMTKTDITPPSDASRKVSLLVMTLPKEQSVEMPMSDTVETLHTFVSKPVKFNCDWCGASCNVKPANWNTTGGGTDAHGNWQELNLSVLCPACGCYSSIHAKRRVTGDAFVMPPRPQQ